MSCFGPVDVQKYTLGQMGSMVKADSSLTIDSVEWCSSRGRIGATQKPASLQVSRDESRVSLATKQ